MYRCTATITETHNFKLDANQSASDATCTKPGETYYICSCTQKKTVYGATNSNNHVNTELRGVVAAKCETPGYTGDTWCKDCNTELEKGSATPALEHKYTNYAYNDGSATCTADGTKTASCDNGCGTTSTITATGTKIDHKYTTYVYDEGSAKCEKDGTKTASCDYNCGTTETITAENTALEHDFTGDIKNNEDGTHSYDCKYDDCDVYGGTVACSKWKENATLGKCECEDCGYTKAHVWGSWSQAEGNTDAAAGKQTRTCTDCSAVETIDCDYNVDHKDATCTTPEITTYKCKNCTHGYTVIGDPATGHNFTADEYKHNSANDTHQQLCANNCGTYGVGTTANAWTACTFTYENKEAGKHTATCVCGNSEEQACEGGDATCTALAVCDKCDTEYGTTTDHSFKGDAVKLNGDVHAFLCEYCGATTGYYGIDTTKDATLPCTGGTATCSAKAVCTVCGDTHGEVNAEAHKWGDAEPDADKAGKHIYTCVYDEEHTKSENCECTSPAVSAPDCETAGYQLNTCDECGYSWRTDPTDALDHEWGAWTPDGNGGHTRTCERAGCVYGENGAAKTETGTCADDATSDVTAPTCTEDGYTTYTCNDCGYEWTADAVDATGHTWTDTKTFLKSGADCLDDAVYYQECSVCKISAENDTTSTGTTWTDFNSALGHDFTEEVVDNAYLKSGANCTDAAVYYKSCTRCDASSEDTAEVATFKYGEALGHDWEDTKTHIKTEANCITDAVYYKECSRCKISSEGETNETWTDIDSKSGHTLTYHEAVEATCVDGGNVEYWSCSLCYKNFSDDKGTIELYNVTTDKLGHDWVAVAYKAATCEEDGHNAHEECSRCDATLDKKVYPATGHNFTGAYYCDEVNGYHSKLCLNECGASGLVIDGEQVKYTVEYDVLDYVITGGEKCDFKGEYVNETDENGVHSHALKCVCGNTTSAVCVDAEPTVVDPTCTTGGYTLHVCDVCEYEWTTDITAALDHDLAETATSNGDGTHSAKCSRCDYATVAEKCSGGEATCEAKAMCAVCGAEYGETTDHKYDDTKWVYQDDATCTADGTEKNSCTFCGEETTRTATGTKTKHDIVDHTYDISGWTHMPEDFDVNSVKEPTCKAEGKAVTYCKNCDYYKTITVKADKNLHAWEMDADGEIVWNAGDGDCTTGMTYVNYCTICGATREKTETVEHNWETVIYIHPTCKDAGSIKEKCSVCGFERDIYYDKVTGEPAELAPTGHKYNGQEKTVEKTCSTYGYTEKECIICHETERTYDEAGGYADHELITVSAIAPSCDADGHNSYEKCIECGFESADKEVYAATGHADKDNDGKCDNCSGQLSEDGTSACNCICHKENWFMRLIYKIINFFWKLFKISKSCNCGAVHW